MRENLTDAELKLVKYLRYCSKHDAEFARKWPFLDRDKSRWGSNWPEDYYHPSEGSYKLQDIYKVRIEAQERSAAYSKMVRVFLGIEE